MLKLFTIMPRREINFSWFKFPGGELHFDITETLLGQEGLHIVTDASNSDEVMLIVLLADTFRHMDRTLELLYTPYARQDRRTSHGEPFSLRAFATVINSCGFKRVSVLDPHSDVTAALIDNIFVRKRLDLVQNNPIAEVLKGENAVILSPDAGAMKTNNVIAKYYKLPHWSATKVRDTSTGEITATQIHTPEYALLKKDVVILDDICDGGRTFIEIGKALEGHSPASIHLYTTIGIYSKGLAVLTPYFKTVECHHRHGASWK